MSRFNKPFQDTPNSSSRTWSNTWPRTSSNRSEANPIDPILTATAVVNLHAIRENFSALVALNPDAFHLAAVKANAYGHGIVEVSQTLAPQADYLGVARLDEAAELRQAGVGNRIIVLSERISDSTANRYVELAATPCLFSDSCLEEQVQLVKRLGMSYWLKVNTGMNRLGVSPLNVEFIRSLLLADDALAPETIVTHFSSSETPDDTKLEQQLEYFSLFCESLPLPKSCKISLANSAACIKQKNAPPTLRTNDIINRIGISLYGISTVKQLNHIDQVHDFPVSEATTGEHPQQLLPAMSLYAPILAIQHVSAGESVGYNERWTAQRDSIIATVGIGYGDGYPRHAKNGCPVLIGTERASLVGTVSMDMIGIDITDIENATSITPGTVVTLWGQALDSDNRQLDTCLGVEQVAACSQTISYQLLTQISQRVKRVYLS